MSDTLYSFYQDELFFIRKMAQDFARQYPAAAARLQLEPNRSTDPHVERLIEAFALLTARVQHKIHDDYPEVTEALLNVLYPHYVAPVPSFATLQFDFDPLRAIPTGMVIEKGRQLLTPRVGDTPCKYRTCHDVTLWPISVTEAKLQPPPFPPGLRPPDKAVAALRLKFQITGEMTWPMLQLGRLRIHLAGDDAFTAPLYELIHRHALQVVFRSGENKQAPPVVLPAAEAIHPVGFGPDDGLLPYPKRSFPGYRLLTEFFAYPAKFLYFDLAGFPEAKRTGAQKQLEVFLFLDRTLPRLEQAVEAGAFRLGCVPVVNLFEHIAEPVNWTQQRSEYKVIPVVGRPLGYEVYSVDSVAAVNPDGTDREFRPFYDFRHGTGHQKGNAFWYATRRPSVGIHNPDDPTGKTPLEDRGSDVFLRLVDPAFDPATPANDVLVIRTTCTNRDTPNRLPRTGEEVPFEPAFSAAGLTVRCPRNPTRPMRPAMRRGLQWRLISHLSLNHLSLTDGEEGRLALLELLRLYDPTDLDGEPRLAAMARQAVEGITQLRSRPTVALANGGFCRGLEVTVEFDEAKYVETSAYLLASVLERFFSLAVNVNSFTQLVARTKQRTAEWKRWPPRAGDKPLL